MDVGSPLPDPATPALPTEALSAVAHALQDLAHAPSSAAEAALPVSPPSSTAHVSARLAALLRGAPLPPHPRDHAADVFTPPTRTALAAELATVHALGVWADSFLGPGARRAACNRLAREVSAAVARVALEGHVDGKVPELTARLRVHPTGDEARRAIFRAALSARYGPLEQAAAAAMLVGPPYVLYLHQAGHASSRVRGRAVGEAVPSGTEGSAVYRAWKRLVRGVAVIDSEALGELHAVRGAVACKLKEAVKERGLAPAVVVLEAELDGSVCAAASVLRAVCDSYAVRLHVEGEALAMLTAGDVTKRLDYDVGELVRCTHSILLDVGSIYGPFQTGVVSHGVGAAEIETDVEEVRPFELSSVMALWFLLERVNFIRSAAIVRSLCEQSFCLMDNLYSIPHLLEVKSVGCGANVLVSYASVDADAECRTAVNRAMLWLFQRRHPEMRHVLSIANHENREWLLLSPTSTLSDCVNPKPVSEQLVRDLCTDLVYAARRCEVVLRAKAAFISEMRQCQDVEVDGLPLLNPKAVSSPLFFAALRVTPFGEVSPNGHWIRDQDMVTKVEKFTYAFASFVEARANDLCDFHLLESGEAADIPFVCIGPELSQAQLASGDGEERKHAAEEGDHEVNPQLSACATYAEEWDLDEFAAQSLALEAAERVTTMIHSALNDGDATPEKNDTSVEEESLASPRAFAVPEHRDVNGRYDDEASRDEDEDVLAERENGSPDLTASSSVPGMSKLFEPGAEYAGSGQEEASEESNEKTEAAEKAIPKKSGFWGLIFGEEDNEESNGSVDGSKPLEEDFFRP